MEINKINKSSKGLIIISKHSKLGCAKILFYDLPKSVILHLENMCKFAQSLFLCAYFKQVEY